MENKFSDRIIKQLLNSVFAKYRDLSVTVLKDKNFDLLT